MKAFIINLIKRLCLVFVSPLMLISLIIGKIFGPQYDEYRFKDWWYLMKHPEQL